MRRSRKFMYGVASLVVAVPLTLASGAWACAALATLTLTPTAAAPGATVTGTGQGFDGGEHGFEGELPPVVIRFDTRTGPILWQGTPDLNGEIAFSFPAPNAKRGQHIVIGMQNDRDTGQPLYGTPARQSLRILGAARSELTPLVAGPTSGPQPPAAVAHSATDIAGDWAPLASLVVLGSVAMIVIRRRGLPPVNPTTLAGAGR